MVGEKRSDETKRKIIATRRKNNSYIAWNKGTKGVCKPNKTSFTKGLNPWNKLEFRIPYPYEFNNDLKELIRKRDNYLCQMCINKQCNEKLSVHHIDFNKKNNHPTNLISLCRKCHLKTNTKNKDRWINLLQPMVKYKNV